MPLALLLLAACGPRVHEDAVQLAWDEGDTFHLGVRYARASQMSDEPGMDVGGESPDPADGAWSDEIVWTIEVLAAGLEPEEGDVLAAWAEAGRGPVSLAVLRARVDPTLNDDVALLDLEPDVYLVFEEERDRLGAIAAFTADGAVEAWDSGDRGRSWSILSQSMLTPAPTLLAPWSLRWRDATTVLEDGTSLTTRADGPDVVEVDYADALGGGIVTARYERDAPWPTRTEAANATVRLLADGEVTGGGAAPAVRDYRAALADAIDVDALLKVDPGSFLDGGLSVSVDDAHAPWAGPWWPQAEGELVFGAEGRPSLSDRIREDACAAAEAIDAERATLDALAPGADRDAALADWRSARVAYAELLAGFYDGLLADLQARRLVVGNGVVSHGDGWSCAVADLSPMDQLALITALRGEVAFNPFYLPAWELLNHFHPDAPDWWGHADGLAGAATLVAEPLVEHEVLLSGQQYLFSAASLKGLLAEAHTETLGPVFGGRTAADGAGGDDFGPASLQRVLALSVIGRGGPLVVDTAAGPEVWPAALAGMDVELVETTDAAAAGSLVNLNTADRATLAALPGSDERLAGRVIEARELWGPFQSEEEFREVRGVTDRVYLELHDRVTIELSERTFEVSATARFAAPTSSIGVPLREPTVTWRYVLWTDPDGLPLRGTWMRADHHPDFAWIPVVNPVAGGRGTENPYLSYSGLVSIVGEDLGGR